MVDCPDFGNLREASFKGVSFQVESDDADYARRIVTHEFPNREDPLHEDLGERFQHYKVTAYVHGSDAEGWRDSIITACRSYGPGLLVLPAMSPFLARCMKCSVNRTKDQQGYFKISMEFHAEFNTAFAGIFVEGAYEGLIAGLGATLAAGMAALATKSLTVRNVLQYAVDNQVTRVKLLAANVADYTEQAVVSDATVGASLVHQATTLYTSAEAYSQAPAALTEHVYTVISNLADAGTAADVLVPLRRLCTFEALQPSPLATTPAVELVEGSYVPVFTPRPASVSAKQDLANATFFNGLVRKFALAFYSMKLATVAFDTRAEAINTRADLVEWFNREIDSVQDDEDMYVVLTKLRDTIVEYLTGSIINAVPILEISAPASMPALYWAHRLYGDAERADEIVARNAMIDPGFTPTIFEALAR